MNINISSDASKMYVFVSFCALCWWINPSAWIADDSYFYLVIARNIALENGSTFSGIVSTNGFHPLWGWLLGCWAKLLILFSPSATSSPRFSIYISFFCMVISVFLYRKFTRDIGVPHFTFLVSVIFCVFFGLLSSEGHLSLLMLVALLWQTVIACRNPALFNLAILGFTAAFAVLSRLDNIFVTVFMLLFVVHSIHLRVGLLSLVPVVFFAAIFGLYLLSNSHLYGGYMPVSGWMKSSFPVVSLQGFVGGANPTLAGVPVIWGWMVMFVAAWICIGVRGEIRGILIVLLAGVVAKNAYIVLFTRSHTGWYWYSTLDLLVFAVALSAWAESHSVQQHKLKFFIYGAAIACAIAMLFKALTWNQPEDGRPHRGLALILEWTSKGDTILVSDFPGYVAFHAPDRQIIAADMLTSNRHWYEEMRLSENAIDFIKASCLDAGKPLTHVLWNGNSWLVVNPGKKVIDFNDPRTYPAKSKIGEIPLQSDPIAVAGDSMLWKL